MNIIRTLPKYLGFSCTWAILSICMAIYISKCTSYDFKTILFIEGILLFILGKCSIKNPINNINSHNTQSRDIFELTNYNIKTLLLLSISNITFTLGSFLIIIASISINSP
ncbi:putative membrane protein [Clostridium bornimense]|uniref:Putative membrane protein n=1 Tax=Clostridium bornimense TaxID=1216932 RepID=W6S0A0_9CLOT|nr:hypothetical protein [Clostridium bornimense]CDM70163.1 putative membrane protein [Clostridium bornimense]